MKAVRAALAGRHRTAPPWEIVAGFRSEAPTVSSIARLPALAAKSVRCLTLPDATSSGRESYRQYVPQPSANFADSADAIDWRN